MSNKPRFKFIAANEILDKALAEPFLRYHYMDDLSVSFRDASACLSQVMIPAVAAYLGLRVREQALGRIGGETGRDMRLVTAWNKIADASRDGRTVDYVDLEAVAEIVAQDILLKQGNPPARADDLDAAYEMALAYISEGGFTHMDYCHIEGREYQVKTFPGNWKPVATDPANPLKNGHPRRMMAYTEQSLNFRTRDVAEEQDDDVPEYMKFRDQDGSEDFFADSDDIYGDFAA